MSEFVVQYATGAAWAWAVRPPGQGAANATARPSARPNLPEKIDIPTTAKCPEIIPAGSQKRQCSADGRRLPLGSSTASTCLNHEICRQSRSCSGTRPVGLQICVLSHNCNGVYVLKCHRIKIACQGGDDGKRPRVHHDEYFVPATSSVASRNRLDVARAGGTLGADDRNRNCCSLPSLQYRICARRPDSRLTGERPCGRAVLTLRASVIIRERIGRYFGEVGRNSRPDARDHGVVIACKT